jgi:hypothetical protein
MSSSNPPENTLTNALRDTLKGLHANPYPEVENPVGCKRRASVALILRVRPGYEAEPLKIGENDPGVSTIESLDRFFSQGWVQRGDPECVFIKRAARVGDRWTR